jgi:threonine dehydrogenase-like Zn-dependent dehydrogenase
MCQLVEAGKLSLRPLISYILPLDQYAKGFELVKTCGALKVLLKP